jgi:phosphate transport system substrate-binding protein
MLVLPERGTTLIASLRHSRATRAAVAGVALTLVLAACGSSSKSGSSGSSGGSGSASTVKADLKGAGSTFQKTFNEAAIQGFQGVNPNVTINYQANGSTNGKNALKTNSVDFAGTDSTIKDADKASYQGGTVLYFPTVAAPITVSYNLSGVDKLQFSASTLAKIFSGKIKKWNDPAIAAENQGVNLPDKDITIVHRLEGSGTTSNFSKFLDTAAKSDWGLGTSDTIKWPAGSQAGQGNGGVAQIVKQTDGAIGYVDYSDAKASNLKFASIQNSSGKYIEPTLAGAEAALAGATINSDLTYNPINASGADAYPITSPTWIIAYQKQTDKNKGQALKDFLTYILGDGQSLAEQAQYAKLSDDLRSKAQAQLSQLQIPS